MNRAKFYANAKRAGLFPMLTQSQVDSIECILDEWGTRTNKHFLAYIFATTKLETGSTFLPIEERGSDSYLSKYWNKLNLRKWLGNIRLADAWTYKGRGYCQITGRLNYKRIGDLLGIDLINHPEKALEPKTAAKIIINGMLGGWFTGKKLSQYWNEGGFDGYSARKIINGLDKADVIEEYYHGFLKCIED